MVAILSVSFVIGTHLDSKIESVSRSVDSAEEAVRSSFCSWFGGTATAVFSPVRDKFRYN